MDAALWIEYSWILVVLIFLEGLLATDNALVIAIMVKHLPLDQQKKALFYGLFGAFVFRFLSLFAISYFVHVWQLQAVGALYLMWVSIKHLYRRFSRKNPSRLQKKHRSTSFWMTVLKVELADIVFAVDSILAAVALAITLPNTPLQNVGGMDGGQFLVVLLGGVAGMIIMRFAASFFGKLLKSRPSLEVVAFLIVGWVGVKLSVLTLCHPAVSILPESFSSSVAWKSIFWTVLLAIATIGWFVSGKRRLQEEMKEMGREAK